MAASSSSSTTTVEPTQRNQLCATRWLLALKEFSTSVIIGRTRLEQTLHRFLCSLMPAASSPPRSITTSSDRPHSSHPVSTLYGDALLSACGTHVPQSVLRNVSTRSMRLSLASGEAHREAALLWRIAELRGAVPTLDTTRSKTDCDAVVSERVAVHNIRRMIALGNWVQACALMHRSVMTDVGLAAGIHAYCAGQQWAVAAELMSLMSPRSWSDHDLSVVFGAMYRVAKYRSPIALQHAGGRHTTGGSSSDRLWQTALRMLRVYRSEKQLLVLQQHHAASGGRDAVPSSTTMFTSPSSISNVLGILGVHKRWEEALLVGQTCLAGLAPKHDVPDEALPSSDAVTSTVQPNVVALAQLCYALHSQWFVALRVASTLLGNGSVRMDDVDAVALQRLLNVCVYGQRWVEAVRLLQGCRLARGSFRQHQAAGMSQTRSPDAGDAKAAAVLGQDVCFRLLHLFGRNGATYPAQAAIVDQHLSKHSNPNIVARSWNAMIQHADTMSDASVWQDKLAAHGFREENESIARMVQLSSREGQWEGALKACMALLHERSQLKHGGFIVTSELHDWTQYALSAAPAPGPRWQVSVDLFSKMVSAQVPLSEVSFQAVVRRCFTQGAAAQANAVFALMMKRGVGRR